MNEEDFRQCLVIMITAGFAFKHGAFDEAEPWKLADRIIEAGKQKEKDDDEEDVGIASVAKRRYKRKS